MYAEGKKLLVGILIWPSFYNISLISSLVSNHPTNQKILHPYQNLKSKQQILPKKKRTLTFSTRQSEVGLQTLKPQ